MTGGVSGYAAINARVRVMYSGLLNTEKFATLSEAPDLPSLVGLLKRTVYGPYLESLKEKEITSRGIAYHIKNKLADAYQSVIHMAPENTRPLLVQLYRYYEVTNLKAVLRGIGMSPNRDVETSLWDRVRGVLFPFGSMTVLSAEAMVEAGSVASAVELLQGTSYYDVLSFAMKRYSAEQSLFPLEVALDLNYWRKLWQEARLLLGEDQGQALRVVGSLIDLNNLMWAIRYRVYQQLSEEELINYTLPFGYHIGDDDIRAIAAGADIGSVVERVYPNISDVESILNEPRSGLPRLELELKRHLMEQCMAAFVGNPFHIGVPLAYLVLSDLEIQDLIVLIEAKSSKLSDEEFRPYLLKTSALRG
jgi:V/A-type H+-transporting ATPase subunit C